MNTFVKNLRKNYKDGIMNTKHTIFKWIVIVVVLGMFLSFAVLSAPAAVLGDGAW